MRPSSTIRVLAFFQVVFAVLLGTAMHFIDNLTPDSVDLYIGWLYPVSESVFEHLKMVYYPLILLALLDWALLEKKMRQSFLLIIVHILYYMSAILLIVLFYVSKLFVAESMVVDILIFIIVTVFVQCSFISSYTRNVPNPSKDILRSARVLGVFLLLFTLLLFVVFTYWPLNGLIFVVS